MWPRDSETSLLLTDRLADLRCDLFLDDGRLYAAVADVVKIVVKFRAKVTGGTSFTRTTTTN